MTSTIEKLAYLVIVLLIAIGAYLSHFQETIFRDYYIVEDGPLESGTAVFLFLTGLLMLARAVRLRRMRSRPFIAVTALVAVVLFFGAGEEISWGQRIFDLETPESLARHNKQGETNLHNLEIGDVSINKLVFSQLLAAGLVAYLFVLPVLATRKEAINKLVESIGIPLPTKIQILMWIIALALPELLVATSKKPEVRETCASLMIFVTLLAPRNKGIYEKSSQWHDPSRS